MATFPTVSGRASPDSCNPPAEALPHGDAGHPRLTGPAEPPGAADGVVIATLVHKVSHAGLLKALLGVPARRGFADKAVLPLVTGHMADHGTPPHKALRTLSRSMGATAIAPGRFPAERAARSVRAARYVHAREQLDRGTGLLRRVTAQLSRRRTAGVRSIA